MTERQRTILAETCPYCAALAGCASPAGAYVAADRAKYDFFAPQIEKWNERAEKAGEIDSTLATLNRMNLRSWDDRIREAEGDGAPPAAPAPAPTKPVPPTATAEPAPARRDDPPAPAAPGGPVW